MDKAATFLEREVVPAQRYYDFETFFSCSPKACLQRNGVIDDLRMWDMHSMQAPQNTLCMQWSAEALRAVRSTRFDEYYERVARLGVKGIAKSTPYSSILKRGQPNGSLMALDIMALYQNVWPLSYRRVAYTYGGFGVQNSDGEFNDARQAQFGSTLCHFGAELGRKDYFERGVAAIRASLTLINHPRHIELGLYPNPNYPLGLQPENNGHGGTDQQNGRTGFDWGEGSGLAAAAEVIDRYGDAYIDEKNRWGVGIDGSIFSPDLKRLASEVHYRPPAQPHFEAIRRQQQQVKTSSGRTYTLELEMLPLGDDSDEMWFGHTSAAGLPDFDPDQFEINDYVFPRTSDLKDGFFVGSGGWRVRAKLNNDFGSSRISAVLRRSNLNQLISFEGQVRGWPLATRKKLYLVDPTFDFTNWRMPGWKFEGNFLNWPTRSTRSPFNAGGKPFIGTCEDGKGGFDDEYTGTITSPWFVVTKPTIKLLVGGGMGPGVYVELLDSGGKRIGVERGRNTETMDERTWDVSRYKGQRLQIRIVDSEKLGWGHINVGNVRCG
jgi:hypothetical protein